MTDSRTPQSDYLLGLGKKILEPYTKLPNARAAMITGSVAEGVSDNYSDLDMTVYYDGELPSEEELARIREANGAPERTWLLGDRAEGNIAEAYELDGIQAQIGHAKIPVWENDIAEILERHNPDTPLHKAMSGTLECIAVYGDEYIDRWKKQIAAYPDGLRRALIEQHLKFFPYWNISKQIHARDATVWHYQILVEASYNLVAILAGLNRLYFTNFQFKKMHRFLNQMTIVPERFGERLEELFKLEPTDAAIALEGLIREVIALVEREMPDVDVTAVKKTLGKRRPPWTIQDDSTPQVVTHPIFNLMGIETRTKNALETSSETARIPQVWGRFYGENLISKIPNRVDSPLVYGVYHKYQSDQNGPYSLLIGVQVTTLDNTPEDLTGITIPEARYLVFSRTGKIPEVVVETWQTIWNHFATRGEFERAYSADFEIYYPDHVEIYVAIK